MPLTYIEWAVWSHYFTQKADPWGRGDFGYECQGHIQFCYVIDAISFYI